MLPQVTPQLLLLHRLFPLTDAAADAAASGTAAVASATTIPRAEATDFAAAVVVAMASAAHRFLAVCYVLARVLLTYWFSCCSSCSMSCWCNIRCRCSVILGGLAALP